MIVGLSGFARAGKDEVANILVRDYGYQRVAFADKLREFIFAVNPVVPREDGMAWMYLQGVINQYGWDGYKDTPYGAEIRRLLQRLGTEGGRRVLWDSIWIDAALTGLDESARVVVTDARFYNEFDAIRARGGDIWRVERPGVGPLNEHASENEAIDYPNFKLTLFNDGTLEDLIARVASIV